MGTEPTSAKNRAIASKFRSGEKKFFREIFQTEKASWLYGKSSRNKRYLHPVCDNHAWNIF